MQKKYNRMWKEDEIADFLEGHPDCRLDEEEYNYLSLFIYIGLIGFLGMLIDCFINIDEYLFFGFCFALFIAYAFVLGSSFEKSKNHVSETVLDYNCDEVLGEHFNEFEKEY